MLQGSLGIKVTFVGLASLLVAACANTDKKQPAIEEAPAPTPAPVVERPVDPGPTPGTQEHLNQTAGDRVLFGFDSYELDASAQATLRAQADWLKQFGSVNVIIEGHCDERGTREYNLALGERRANAVKNYLASLGIAASRLESVSYGKERPAVIGSSEEAWSQNRRGVLVVK